MKHIGLVVPSSNTTMEHELPTLFRRRETHYDDRFVFRSSRVGMQRVDADSLAQMNQDAERAVSLLADAAVDVQAYACLVAIMSQGFGAHRRVSEQLAQVAKTPFLSSAGALVEGLRHLRASRVALMCPYMRPLAAQVVDYLENEGIEVVDYLALEIDDNLAVGRLDPLGPARLVHELDVSGVDAIIASACVQMPSLESIPVIETETGLPTLSAATATAWQILRALDLPPHIHEAGALLQNPN